MALKGMKWKESRRICYARRGIDTKGIEAEKKRRDSEWKITVRNGCGIEKSRLDRNGMEKKEIALSCKGNSSNNKIYL